jgi:hypothetical protein
MSQRIQQLASQPEHACDFTCGMGAGTPHLTAQPSAPSASGLYVGTDGAVVWLDQLGLARLRARIGVLLTVVVAGLSAVGGWLLH